MHNKKTYFNKSPLVGYFVSSFSMLLSSDVNFGFVKDLDGIIDVP